MGLMPLKVRGAVSRRQGKVLVGPVDLDFEATGVTIVIGPNGAGKTSLLRLLHGIQRLSAGTIEWSCGIEEARQKQGFVFQSPVMMRRTVRDNIAYPLLVAGETRKRARLVAEEWAGRVGIGEMLNQQAAVLSGGERQKLALARAFTRNPEVLFLDEPCASLDGRSTREIEALLHEATARGTRLIMSTHDMGQAKRLASEVVFLVDGKVHEAAPATQFFDSPKSSKAAAFLNGDIVD
ncbi:ATP-binding cassette domain-containing protein [Primorskyibacter sp. S87]|uniref:ATP-binding cassette domain-containing protein n=1 Tax=Primorskyibacter sp. S87 TaxID=3415126 RepID=UPI003C7E1B9D